MADLPDFYPGGADVYLHPEWAVKKGNSKTLAGSIVHGGTGWEAVLTYAVPATKTLSLLSANCFSDGTTNRSMRIAKNGVALYNLGRGLSADKNFPIQLEFNAGDIVTVDVQAGVAGDTWAASLLGVEE